MKLTSFLLLFLLFSVTLAADLGPFQSILREIHTQSAQCQGSPEHEALLNQRDREYGIGDQDTFWRWNLTVMPPAWVQEDATCRAVGEHCYVFVADDQWDVNMTQADVDSVLHYLEETTFAGADYGAIEMDTLAFGPIPDELDNDPRLIVYYTALGSFNGTSFDGYFSAYNQVTEAEAQQMNPSGHSNECEMIYMTCHPLDPTEPIRISVLAHELQHLIHWGADANEETWVDEGCAELAMVLFGMPDPITGFNTNPDNDLTFWDNTTFSSYVKVMLFFTYLYEHFGGDALIYDLVQEPANGVEGIDAQLIAHEQGRFKAAFGDWTIANFLNDPVVEDGHFSYSLLDLPVFHTQSQHSSFPATGDGSVSMWAAEYIRFLPGEFYEFHISASANEIFQLALIAIGADDEDSEVFVYEGETDFDFDFTFDEGQFSSITLAITGLDEAIEYEYDIESLNNDVADNTIPEAPLSLTVGPNPARSGGTVRFSLSQLSPNAQAAIYDIRGRLVRQLPLGAVEWDTRNTRGEAAPSGVYLYRVESGEQQFTGKLLLTR